VRPRVPIAIQKTLARNGVLYRLKLTIRRRGEERGKKGPDRGTRPTSSPGSSLKAPASGGSNSLQPGKNLRGCG